MEKDWTGNSRSAIVTIGGNNYTEHERAYRDFYATPPDAVVALLEKEMFSSMIWEPAAGMLHISKTLENYGYYVFSSDIECRCDGITKMDFLSVDCDEKYKGDIITNPPYSKAEEFVRKALEVIHPGNKVAMLLRIQFLEGIKRRKLFEEYPPYRVYVFSKRIKCAMNGDFKRYNNSGAMSFAWFVWKKGDKEKTVIDWI